MLICARRLSGHSDFVPRWPRITCYVFILLTSCRGALPSLSFYVAFTNYNFPAKWKSFVDVAVFGSFGGDISGEIGISAEIRRRRDNLGGLLHGCVGRNLFLGQASISKSERLSD